MGRPRRVVVEGRGAARAATPRAGLGLHVRTGAATAVVVVGSPTAPEIVFRHELELADPWVRASGHPYHAALRDPTANGEATCRQGCAAARAATLHAVRALVEQIGAHGYRLATATLVAPRANERATIAGAHARAHASERALYRGAVEVALSASRARCTTVREHEIRARAARRLGLSPAELDDALRAFSRTVGTPWRAPEKAAALAAWLALADG